MRSRLPGIFFTPVVSPAIVTGGQVEKYGEGDTWTGTVGAAQSTTGGLLVEFMSGDRIVRTAQAASVICAGVALHDQTAGLKVTIASEGIWLLIANGSIAAGQLVVCATGGQVSQAGATPDARTIVGKAFADATNGNLVPIRLRI